MLVSKPIENPILDSAVAEIRAAGVEPSPIQVVWIYQIAQQEVNPNGNSQQAFFDAPFSVGGVWLYPMTAGCRMWMNEYADKFFANNQRDYLYAMGFGLAHAMQPETLLVLTNEIDARRAVRRWSCGLKCSDDALTDAVKRVLGIENVVEVGDPEPKKESPMAEIYGDLIASVCHAYKLTPHYVMWEISEDSLRELLNKMPLPPGYEAPKDDGKNFALFVARRAVIKAIIERGNNG